jgi:hypothetical protein
VNYAFCNPVVIDIYGLIKFGDVFGQGNKIRPDNARIIARDIANVNTA